jgi:hypothetical protein
MKIQKLSDQLYTKELSKMNANVKKSKSLQPREDDIYIAVVNRQCWIGSLMITSALSGNFWLVISKRNG